MDDKKLMIFLPTLNERKNLEYLLPRFEALPLKDFIILVVDDQSDDGTEDYLRNYRSARFQIELVRRPPPSGRGYAGREAFRIARQRAVDILVEMDADGSHDPAELPRLLKGLAETSADLVIGSRRSCLMKSFDQWSFLRQCMSLLSNFYARLILGVSVWDCNTGYRCYSQAAVRLLSQADLKAAGSNIIHEVLYVVHHHRMKIAEVPITFHARQHGKTRKRVRDLIIAFGTCLLMRTPFWNHNPPATASD